MLKAILFDFDGTVVQSLQHIHPVWKKALLRQGIDLTDEEIVNEVYYATVAEREAKYGLRGDLLHQHFRELIEAVHQEYEIYEGVDMVLRELKRQGIKTAIVTLGHAPQVKNILERLGLTGHFDIILGGIDAGRPKPHPDIALKAMELLDVEAQDTLLVGDSIMDMMTGKSAGVRVGLFMPPINAPYSNTEVLRASAPDFMFAHFSELMEKIEALA